MTPPRNPSPNDPDRLIDAFLAEGQTDLPDEVYDEVRAEIDHTNQRTFIGPWRTSFVTRSVFAAAVAAVVVVAVIVGLQLGSGPLVGSGPSASASPSESAEPSESPAPSPSPTAPAEESAAPSGPEPAFTCDLPIQLPAVGSDFHPLVVADIRVGTHAGYDRIVFEYVLDGTPEPHRGRRRAPVHEESERPAAGRGRLTGLRGHHDRSHEVRHGERRAAVHRIDRLPARLSSRSRSSWSPATSRPPTTGTWA